MTQCTSYCVTVLFYRHFFFFIYCLQKQIVWILYSTDNRLSDIFFLFNKMYKLYVNLYKLIEMDGKKIVAIWYFTKRLGIPRTYCTFYLYKI